MAGRRRLPAARRRSSADHVQGTIRGVAAVYRRGEFLPERRAALEAWAAHVLACGEGRRADAPAGTPVEDRGRQRRKRRQQPR